MAHRILILGGTTEARQLAGRLAGRTDVAVTLSLAGRTVDPVVLPVPVRRGGFGGAQGLARYLSDERIDLLVDATHPYAAGISRNAAEVASVAGVSIVALRRPAWMPVPGDRWTLVENGAGAVAALGEKPRRVFLALGRQEIADFEAAPQHAYVIRSVDPVEPPLNLPTATYILARGPFREEDEQELLTSQRIDVVVAKNSGGAATYGKIAAARELGIEVVLLRRPQLPEVPAAASVAELLDWIDHWLDSVEKRGV
ncbi:cobalt-precorrin-6A reductase [Pseudaminobacter sp. NGMCC 1.201702]|uniref:cobalt-precorrin-6A reductase n=1 Tax=Pseudaminobacter sp. NGMCC 1.201702 TaxID=3391825 RepID=UPI0039EFF279